ncbi:MAG TPA: hypothetical protein VKF62_10000, partial [Planctomycetota bacterium]|nr:hypothetical protein [Planctomycetota bacterium]
TPAGGNSLWHGDGICGDIGAGPTCLDNGSSAIQTLPFPFAFFGAAKTQYRANVNGWVMLNGTGGTSESFTNTGLPSAAGPGDIACPWWDDQEMTLVGSSRISALLTGSPGAQVLTIQWTANATWSSANFCPFNDGSSLSYQVRLFEATGNLEFRYNHAGFVAGTAPISASVGAEDASETVGVDATGLGTGNATFPASGGSPTDLLLAPSLGTYAVSPIPPVWSSISGAPGEVVLLAPSPSVPPGTVPMPGSFGTNAASYNRGDQVPPAYNYATGGANAGAIVSPNFVVPPGVFDLAVAYDTHREMETNATFDQCFVETRAGASPAWSQVLLQTSNSTCSDGPMTVTASGAATQILAGSGGGQIRFRVNTVDGLNNTTDGWSVDNISVAVASVPGIARMTPPAPCPGSGGCVPVLGWSGGAPSLSAPGPFALTLSRAFGGAPAVVVVGVSSGSPFPFNLGNALGGGPCYQMNEASSILFGLTTTGSGPCQGGFSLPIFLSNATPGGPIFGQAFVLDLASPLLGLPVVASDQLAVTVLP